MPYQYPGDYGDDGGGGGGGSGPSASDIGSAVGNNLRGGGPVPSNILMGVGAPRQVAAGVASARVQLSSSGIRGVSITAIGGPVRIAIGSSTVEASSTSHYIPENQSRDFLVSPSQYVAAIRADGVDAVLEITELN